MPNDLSDFLTWSWKVLVAQGVVAVVLGIVALVWPGLTVLVWVILFGIWALIDGIAMAAAAFRPGPTGRRVLFGVMAIIAFVAAGYAFIHPQLTSTTLVWVLGVWLIVRGVFELIGSFSSTSSSPRWLLVVSGLLDLVIGVLFVTNPVDGLVALVWVIGVMAIIWGIVFIVLGLTVRKGAGQLEVEAGSVA